MTTGRDGALVCAALRRAGIAATECETAGELISAIDGGAGVVLVTEESLQGETDQNLVAALEDQPVWSDLPVILFSVSGRNAETLLNDLGSRINVMVVERPIRVAMLISAVRGALRARQRQYEIRDLLLKLEEADKQKDLFLATLSHELRTPLNSMIGWIKLLRERNDAELDVDHAIDVIERNARSQAEMISDILFLSRVVTGKLELKRQPVVLADAVQNVIDMIRPAAEAKHVELTFENEVVDVEIDGDAERLRQIFLNLLSNAVKFTPEHGHVSLRLQRAGPNVEIVVRDDGVGIPAEFLPYVFERFRQADNSYTRRSGGLGLGLAIVRHLVELHGGAVRAESEGQGRGTAIFVSLPLAVAGTKPKTPPYMYEEQASVRASDDVLRGSRVLVVEDDEDSREMLRTVLAHKGVSVMTATTAAEGLRMIQEFRPDLLISDVGLPKEDGYDLIRKVRSLPDHKAEMLPAIALTGYASLQDRSTALEAGFQEHIAKPVDTDILIEFIAKLLPNGAKLSARS
jgi:signal transduction histidine kinase/ActR/RegA family two-component response regulator